MSTFENIATDAVRWTRVIDTDVLRRVAVERILDAAGRAIEQRGRFLIVLAGGTTPRGVYELLRNAAADWSRWHLYFGDERCLPADGDERNSSIAGRAWLWHVAIPKEQVHTIPAERGATEAARRYIDTLREVGEFDLVLLGLGEDGHTAGLFPGHDWGTSPGALDVLAVFDAPKPPPERVTLSAARLSRSREVLFLVSGATKREALAEWRAGAALPVTAIRPATGSDVLFTD